MKTLTDIKEELETLVADVQALIDAPVETTAPTVTEVDVKESDGTEETFEPKVEEPVVNPNA